MTENWVIIVMAMGLRWKSKNKMMKYLIATDTNKLFLRYGLLILVQIIILMSACGRVKETAITEDMQGIDLEMKKILDSAMMDRKDGNKDNSILLLKKCIEMPGKETGVKSAELVSEAMIQLYNTYQWAERWHDGAEWFDSLYRHPSAFIAENCQRNLSVFTAMSLSRDNRDSIAEEIIEKALCLPAHNYTLWKYFRDYAYASAILYTDIMKTDKAIEYAEKALGFARQCESSKDEKEPNGKSYVISILGNLYKRSGRLKEGASLIKDGIADAVERKDTMAQINGYNALTEMMLYWNIGIQANIYSQKAMSLLDKYSGLIEDPLVAAISFAYRGRVKTLQKSDSVLYFWSKAEEISRKMPYTFGMDELDLLVSEYCIEACDSFPEARRRLQRAAANSSRDIASKAYYQLARISLKEGNEAAAVAYADSMLMARESTQRKPLIPGGNAFGLSLALKNNDDDKIRLFSKALVEEYEDNTDPMNTRQLIEIVARHYLGEKEIEVSMEKARMKNTVTAMAVILAGSILVAIFMTITMIYRNRLAKTRQLLLKQRLDSLLSSNSNIRKSLEKEQKRNSEIQSNLDLVMSSSVERQKIGADAISKVKTPDGLGDFLVRFNILYPSFIPNLKRQAPDIGKREQLLCMLMILGCDTEQISNLMCVATKSVNMARWRLRKKLGLASDQSLDALIRSMAEGSSST